MWVAVCQCGGTGTAVEPQQKEASRGIHKCGSRACKKTASQAVPCSESEWYWDLEGELSQGSWGSEDVAVVLCGWQTQQRQMREHEPLLLTVPKLSSGRYAYMGWEHQSVLRDRKDVGR